MDRIYCLLNITHTDLDGIACNIVARRLINTRNEYNEYELESIFIDQPSDLYNRLVELNHDIQSNGGKYKDYYMTQIFITDLSISDDKTADLLDEMSITGISCSIIVIDHHRSSLQYVRRKFGCIILPEKQYITGLIPECGASLFYSEYCDTNVNMDTFIEMVRLHDTYTFAGSKIGAFAEELQLLFTSLDRESFIDKVIGKINDSDSIFYQWDNDERAMIDAAKERMESAYAQVKSNYADVKLNSDTAFGETYIAVFSARSNVSYVCDRLLTEFPDIDIAVNISLPYMKVDLRTHSDKIDLSKIAQKYGGGGHQKAAGFQLNSEMLRQMFQAIANFNYEEFTRNLDYYVN